jgi:hypothetical protein
MISFQLWTVYDIALFLVCEETVQLKGQRFAGLLDTTSCRMLKLAIKSTCGRSHDAASLTASDYQRPARISSITTTVSISLQAYHILVRRLYKQRVMRLWYTSGRWPNVADDRDEPRETQRATDLPPPSNIDTAAKMTGPTLTISPSPAYAGGILNFTNAPAASKIAKTL